MREGGINGPETFALPAPPPPHPLTWPPGLPDRPPGILGTGSGTRHPRRTEEIRASQLVPNNCVSVREPVPIHAVPNPPGYNCDLEVTTSVSSRTQLERDSLLVIMILNDFVGETRVGTAAAMRFLRDELLKRNSSRDTPEPTFNRRPAWQGATTERLISLCTRTGRYAPSLLSDSRHGRTGRQPAALEIAR